MPWTEPAAPSPGARPLEQSSWNPAPGSAALLRSHPDSAPAHSVGWERMGVTPEPWGVTEWAQKASPEGPHQRKRHHLSPRGTVGTAP